MLDDVFWEGHGMAGTRRGPNIEYTLSGSAVYFRSRES